MIIIINNNYNCFSFSEYTSIFFQIFSVKLDPRAENCIFKDYSIVSFST